MAKPTGITGPLLVGTEADGTAKKEFQQLEFPKDKSGIEQLVAEGFVSGIATLPGPNGEVLRITNLAPNKQDDFDFSIEVDGQPAYLELLEAAPLRGRYDQAPAQYKPYDYAQQVLAQIGEKAFKYPRTGVRPIYLLVYVTHWAFISSDSSVNCLRYWLAALPSPFAAVFLSMPIMGKEGATAWLNPGALPAGFHPNQVINRVVTNFDPRTAEVLKEGTGITFPPIKG